MLADNPDIELDTIEMATNALRSWNAGIRLFPAIKIGDDILAGMMLNEEKIRQFIAQHR